MPEDQCAVYLDARLFGVIQRSHIDQLTETLSRVFDGTHLARRVAALEQHIAHFGSTYWRQHLTHHGPANDILLAFQTHTASVPGSRRSSPRPPTTPASSKTLKALAGRIPGTPAAAGAGTGPSRSSRHRPRTGRGRGATRPGRSFEP
jgi:hypothetical protein